MLRFIQLLIYLTLTSTYLAKYCPREEDLYPCTCNFTYDHRYSTEIVCQTNEDLNLTEIFSKVSQDLNAVQEIYNKIHISDEKLVEITENALGNLSFNKIDIGYGCSSLKRINVKAFSYQSKSTNQVFVYAENVISDQSPQFFYDLFNSFTNLTFLTYNSTIGTLEEKFSEKLYNMEYITVKVDAIKGNPFSKMNQIKSISLIGGELNYIPRGAFRIGSPRDTVDKYIWLDLSKNKLNGSSFEIGVFNESSWKGLIVRMFLNRNQIEYFDEVAFSTFLSLHEENLIWSSNNPLNCDDCRSAWICQLNRYRSSFVEAKCIDGRKLIDCDRNFLKCKPSSRGVHSNSRLIMLVPLSAIMGVTLFFILIFVFKQFKRKYNNDNTNSIN